jgi:hypothetical protein
MPTIVQGYVFGKRTTGLMNCAVIYPGAAQGNGYGGWTDVSEQIDAELGALPIGAFYGEITTTQATVLNADPLYLVIGWRNVDTDTGVGSGGNWTQVLTTLMVTALKTWFTTNWIGIPAELLTRMDTLVGMTRIQAAWAARDFIKSRADAGV